MPYRVNIFILSDDPVLAAQYQVDVHVVKMPLESAQLLSTAAVELFPEHLLPSTLYRPTHKNHPCTIWTRSSYANFRWLCMHGLALCREYTYRYGKIHKSKAVITSLYSLCRNMPRDRLTSFALAMPEDFQFYDPVLSYRTYYKHKRDTLPRFTYTNRPIPEWLI